MNRRVTVAVLLAALVALSGCSSALPGSDGSAGDEEALQSSSESIESFSYPDGASATGITDIGTLLDEHDEALSGESLRLVGSTNLTIGGTENEGTLALDYTVANDADAGRTLSTLDPNQNETLTTYADGSTRYYRIGSGSDAEYGTGEPGEGFGENGPQRYTGRTLLRTMLGQGNFTATGVVERNGTDLVRYEMSEITAQPLFEVGDGDREFEGTIYVDQQGVIRQADVSVSVRSDGGFTYVYDSHVEIRDVGSTTVEEPDWISQAR